MYTKEQFLADVVAEAKALKANATSEEIDRLDFEALRPEDKERCIYGQMTGSCDSERALGLITTSASRFIVDSSFSLIQHDGFERIQQNINGEIVEDLASKRHGSYAVHYSAIEGYILIPGAKNKELISFLRSETEELNLDF